MIATGQNQVGGDEWNAFVETAPGSTLCHLHGWLDVVRAAYNHETFALSAIEGGKLLGVLPAVLISSRIFGRSLVSMPFLDDGGPLAATHEAARALTLALQRLAEEKGATLDLRSPLPVEGDGLVPVGDKVSMTMPLAASEEKLLKSLPPTRRNRIRKAAGNGLTAKFPDCSRLPEFYRVFCRNMRDLGSPVHSLRFFSEILRAFPGRTGLVLVEEESGKVLGAGLWFRHGNTMSLPWVSSIRDEFGRYPNITLYWELMRRAVAEGCDKFNFGRSSVNSGTYEFKRQWGASPEPLYWYAPAGGEGAGLEGALRKSGSKKELVMKAWARLPLPVANFAGPLLRRSISL